MSVDRPAAEDEESSRAHRLLLDALEGLVERGGLPNPPGRLRALICRMAAGLVAAPAAGHVRFDAHLARAHLTVWRASSPGGTRILGQAEYRQAARADWWIASVSRRRLFEALGQRHLAELPMDDDADHPTLLVVGRATPFTSRDAERLNSELRSLRALERLVEWLLVTSGPVAPPSTDPEEPTSPITSREQEVLELLSEGLLARSIAQRLEVSERTIHKHLGSLYRKLDAHDRLLAVQRAESLGLLAAPGQAGW